MSLKVNSLCNPYNQVQSSSC